MCFFISGWMDFDAVQKINLETGFPTAVAAMGAAIRAGKHFSGLVRNYRVDPWS